MRYRGAGIEEGEVRHRGLIGATVTWMNQSPLWQANRKVFLCSENWIDPTGGWTLLISPRMADIRYREPVAEYFNRHEEP